MTLLIRKSKRCLLIGNVALAALLTVPAHAEAAPPQSQEPQDQGAPVHQPHQPVPAPAVERSPLVGLPAPSADPLRRNDSADPVLQIEQGPRSTDQFIELLQSAVLRHPSVDGFRAGADAAAADYREARAQLLPSGEISLATTVPIVREFESASETLYERTRSRQRTDLTLNAEQILFDFGSTAQRVEAASERRDAAVFASEDAADRFLLQAASTYYEVATYRILTQIARSFLESQEKLREGVLEQIAAGRSAEGDLAQVDAMIASGRSRTVRYERLTANAEAFFFDYFGVRAPDNMVGLAPPKPGFTLAMLPHREVEKRAEILAANADVESRSTVLARAATSPAVSEVKAQAAASRYEAKAARRSMLPSVSVGLGAGRYGVFEGEDDYDVRARLSVTQRFGGGLDARADASSARARQATYRAQEVERATLREAEIAWIAVTNLREQVDAARASYIANRNARDVLIQRFRYTRGTLFNVLSQNDDFLASAADYVLGVNSLTIAQYTLLARTGQLAETLGIETRPEGDYIDVR